MGTRFGMTVCGRHVLCRPFFCSENMMDDLEKGRTPLGADGARGKNEPPCSGPLPARASRERPSPAEGGGAEDGRPCSVNGRGAEPPPPREARGPPPPKQGGGNGGFSAGGERGGGGARRGGGRVGRGEEKGVPERVAGGATAT